MTFPSLDLDKLQCLFYPSLSEHTNNCLCAIWINIVMQEFTQDLHNELCGY